MQSLPCDDPDVSGPHPVIEGIYYTAAGAPALARAWAETPALPFRKAYGEKAKRSERKKGKRQGFRRRCGRSGSQASRLSSSAGQLPFASLMSLSSASVSVSASVSPSSSSALVACLLPSILSLHVQRRLPIGWDSNIVVPKSNPERTMPPFCPTTNISLLFRSSHCFSSPAPCLSAHDSHAAH